MSFPVIENLIVDDLPAVNAVRARAKEPPIPTVKYVCHSPSGSRRVVYDYNTIDDEPQIIIKRRRGGWRIDRWVLHRCGTDTLNPLGWVGYACVDDHFITPGWRTVIKEHRELCAK